MPLRGTSVTLERYPPYAFSDVHVFSEYEDFMSTCFVIQPFDSGRFDKRFRDTFQPAIEAAGLEAYRVDQDPSAEIPIQHIQAGIERAEVCFAEISLDNPNVWFELGYAIAAKKPVVMVCSEERSRFPFDVQHRSIIRYSTESVSDFAELGREITRRLVAAVERQMSIEEIADRTPVAETEGLSQQEIVALVSVAGSSLIPDEAVSAYLVKQDMNRAGFTDVAISLAARALLKKGYLEPIRKVRHG